MKPGTKLAALAATLATAASLATATDALAMTEAEFKKKCLAEGGTYTGPANDGLGTFRPTSGPGTCSWSACQTKYTISRRGYYFSMRPYTVCTTREVKNMSMT